MLTFSHLSQAGIDHGILVADEALPDQVQLAEQVHKNTVEWVKEYSVDRIPRTDALLTRAPGVGVGVRHADCVPVVIADPKQGVVGAIHAGWRGTALEVTRKTIEALKFSPHNVLVGIGPAIGPDSFIVGQEVAEQFPRNCVEQIVDTSEGEAQFTVDLWQANIEQLLEVGVRERNIEVIRRDTFRDSELYSFRGGDRDARNITWIRK